jgi:hypothetical protein
MQILLLLMGLQLGLLITAQPYIESCLASLEQSLGEYQGEGMPAGFMPYVHLHHSFLKVCLLEC